MVSPLKSGQVKHKIRHRKSFILCSCNLYGDLYYSVYILTKWMYNQSFMKLLSTWRLHIYDNAKLLDSGCKPGGAKNTTVAFDKRREILCKYLCIIGSSLFCIGRCICRLAYVLNVYVVDDILCFVHTRHIPNDCFKSIIITAHFRYYWLIMFRA